MNFDHLGWLSWFFGGGRGDASEVAVFESVGVAAEVDDVGVVDEAVDHGGGDDVVAEHFAPPAERLVGCDDQGCSFVAVGDELEEQVRCFGFEGDVADLVDLCRCRHRSTYAGPVIMPMRDAAGAVLPCERAGCALLPTTVSA